MVNTSSDSNFEWTDASSQDSASDSENITMVANKTTNSHNDDDTESGKDYKKRLHKQLSNGDDGPNDAQEIELSKKAKKRKIKEESTENSYSPIENEIKKEPESDIENTKKKKKSKHRHSDSFSDQCNSQMSIDESFLNLKVKDEEAFFASKKSKKKKKSKVRDSSQESEVMDDIGEGNVNEELNNSLKSEMETKRKKKKSNKNKDDISVSDTKDIIEDMFSAEETVVEERKNKKKKMKNALKNKSILEISFEKDEVDCNIESKTLENVEINIHKRKQQSLDEDCAVRSNQENDVTINHSGISDCDTNSENSETNDNESNKNVSPKKKKTQNKPSENYTLRISSDKPEIPRPTQRISRISERITFEDDNDSETDDKQNTQNTNKTSIQMKNYIKTITDSYNLKQSSSNLGVYGGISDDDDIWILNCSNDINIDALENKEIVIDKNCKFKINSQTYEGVLNEDTDRVVISTVTKGEHVIKTFPVKGTINFHKRVPKPHTVENNSFGKNQTDFTPLPEIKCRHPLFGADYKHAIKLPKAIAGRLKCIEDTNEHCETVPLNTERRKRKKHRCENNDQMESLCEVAKLEPESNEQVTVKKKKKKRKHSIDNYYEEEEPAPKKVKKIKHNISSAEAWESEKAIEENLFNF